MTVLQLLNPEKKPVIPNTRKISGLVEAVAVLSGRVIQHTYTARNDEGRNLSFFRNTVIFLVAISS